MVCLRSALLLHLVVSVALLLRLGFDDCWAAELETKQPLAAEDAAQTMVVPEGFHVTLFAAEPDVRQPIGFCIDDRGRLWVAEAYNYPHHGTGSGDRIVILEDTDHDGRFDRRKVFYDQLNYVTGIEVGFGGVWVMSPPFFYFIADHDQDDAPDSAPVVLLDGFGNHANSHNLANALAWGPDGWLYGTHGRTNWSRIGKPGTPDAQRQQFDGGVYRYHPLRHQWESFADGTTNPWGIDWNDFGEGFVCNCVNPHLFHVIQGAHYEPWRNRQSSRYAYQRIDTIADHLHYSGELNVRDGLGSQTEDALGGGHAHSGTMIYLGDNWPDRYRHGAFMNNIHGKRINHDLLRQSGSGYVASHGPDLLKSRDPWHMGVTLGYGPDGGVFLSDWSDTGPCHTVTNTRRETGRIFKITYGPPPSRPVDPSTLSAVELVALHTHRNDWYVRHARRLLQERAARGEDLSASRIALLELFQQHAETPGKLRALWSLHAIGELSESFLIEQLGHASEHLRAWSIRLLCEEGAPSQVALERFEALAAGDPSPVVRLYLASALQRLPAEQRWPIAVALLNHREDAEDANLPLMYWYAIEPLVDDDWQRFLTLLPQARIPLVAKHIARRVAAHRDADAGLPSVVASLTDSDDPRFQLAVLSGLALGLEGRRTVPIPAHWPAAFAKLQRSNHSSVKQESLELALIFDDPHALRLLTQQAMDAAAPVAQRRRALAALVVKKPTGTAELLIESLNDPAVRDLALRGLAEFDHPRTAETLIESLASFSSVERQDALQTLASRVPWGLQLIAAVESGRIPRTELTAYTARQLESLGDEALTDRLRAAWGEVRGTAAEKAKQIAGLRERLASQAVQQANLASGRAVFEKSCANCHRLFDSGGGVGPDITGSQRSNLDYLLENLIDPNAAVARDYQMEVIATVDGRVVTGMVIDQSDNAVTMQTVNERLVIPSGEVQQRTLSAASMMPEGLVETLSFAELRDLIAYLGSSAQVAAPQPPVASPAP